MAEKYKFINFKEGALIKSTVIRREDNAAVKLKDIIGVDSKYIFIMYKKEAGMFTATSVDEVKGFKFINMTVFAKTDPREFLMLIKGMIPKGAMMIWQSGICQAKKEDYEKYGMKEDGCIWECVLKLPESESVNKISEAITSSDKNGIIASVNFTDILTSDIK